MFVALLTRYIFFTKPYFYAIINVKHDQHIKVCDEIDFDNLLFDLALW
jgi:hypothetical protein